MAALAKSLQRLILLLLALALKPGSAAAQSIEYYNGHVRVPVINGKAPSVYSRGGTIATGQAANIMASGHRKTAAPKNARPSAPPIVERSCVETKSCLMIPADGRIIAGMYELVPGAYVFSRHALRGNGELAAALGEFELYEFLHPSGARRLDVLLAVKRGRALADLFARGAGSALRLRDHKRFARALTLGQSFTSRHVSTVSESAVERVSQGKISSVGMALDAREAPFVDAFVDTDTGPGSSGALVMVNEGGRWKAGGIASCRAHPVLLAKKNHRTLGGIRLITIRSLLHSVVQRIPVQDVVAETQEIDPNCTPIDNRGGGGI